MKMEQTGCSETSAYKNSDAGELPRRKHKHTEHCESFEIKNMQFVRISFEKPRRWDIQAIAVLVDSVHLLTLRTQH